MPLFSHPKRKLKLVLGNVLYCWGMNNKNKVHWSCMPVTREEELWGVQFIHDFTPARLGQFSDQERLSVTEGIEYLANLCRWMRIRGRHIRAIRRRLNLYTTKGTDCIECGLKGLHFRPLWIEDAGMWTLRLFGIDEHGIEVPITRDHIIPKSLGGPGDLSNLQPMCEDCNRFKDNAV